MTARVLTVAHFPPPVHGMAAAVERLVRELEQVAAVRRVTVSAPSLERSATYHLVRVMRVLRALIVVVLERRRCVRVLFSCDAGLGMVYTLALTAVARVLGYRIFLQHHSYAYLNRRSMLLAAIVWVTSGRCTHLVTCARMRDDFRRAYPRAALRVVGIASGIELAPEGPRPAGTRLVLGFLSNVSLEKGVDVAVATARAAGRAGLPVELRVAGPVIDPEAARLLAAAVNEFGEDPLNRASVTWLGPVYAADRDAFLDGLDAFVFPSRYIHESFGLAAWEAMARGVPVLAHRSGCLTADAVGAGGVVIERDEDFVAPAVATVHRWWRDPTSRQTAADAAREVARVTVAAAERDTLRFCRELAVPASAPSARDRPAVTGG